MAEIKHIIPFTYKWEGGLSNAKTDSASANPSPYIYKGVGGWHTNKGVTYPAFREGSKTLGYQDTAQNFLTMPEDIWLKIAKNKYWDELNLDKAKSQAIANLMFSWQWGSGYAWRNRMQNYLNTKGITWNKSDLKGLVNHLNNVVDKEGEKKIFDELVEQKKQFLLSLKGTKSNPVTEKAPEGVYTKGWLNRLKDLQTYSYTLLEKGLGATKEFVKKKTLTTIVLTSLLVVSGYLIYKYYKKQN